MENKKFSYNLNSPNFEQTDKRITDLEKRITDLEKQIRDKKTKT